MVETKYIVRIEFEEIVSLHVHSYTWIINAPDIENEAAYIEFMDKTTNTQLPDLLNDAELFELVKTCSCSLELVHF